MTNINTLDIHICKMCLDIIDPIKDNGIYIINHEAYYEVIIVNDGINTSKNYQKLNYPTYGRVIDNILLLYNYNEQHDTK